MDSRPTNQARPDPATQAARVQQARAARAQYFETLLRTAAQAIRRWR